MAYIAYPIAKAHPSYGDIYHDAVPVIVTTAAEYADTLQLSRADCGCEGCDDATPLAITLGPTQCGVWIEGEVLLDILRRSADEMVAAFGLSTAWWWSWEQDFKGRDTPDAAVLRAPHEVREV